jgi:hypothetical protein
MDQQTRGITPLRRRMIDDMRMRKLEEKTQTCYIRAVRKLAAFLERSPDTASAEDLRRFQLHLVDSGCSPITLNATITGLKFFFDVTVGLCSARIASGSAVRSVGSGLNRVAR